MTVENSSLRPADAQPPDAEQPETLMRRCVDGDEVAFEALYPRLVRAARPVARRFFTDRDEVEEVVQLTLIRVHQSRARFDVRRSVEPWVRRIARNVAIDQLRRAKATRLVRDEALLQRVPDEGLGADEASSVETSERSIEEVRRAIDDLPDSSRSIIRRHKLDGEPLKNIASELGLQYGATRVRAHRGYKRLVELLTARGSGSLRAG